MKTNTPVDYITENDLLNMCGSIHAKYMKALNKSLQGYASGFGLRSAFGIVKYLVSGFAEPDRLLVEERKDYWQKVANDECRRIITEWRKNNPEQRVTFQVAPRLESDLERIFVNKVKAAGGLALKFISPSMNGVPDRIVLYCGHTHFVELKLPHTKPFRLQESVHKMFEKKGHKVWIIRTVSEIEQFIKHIETVSLNEI